MQIYKYDERWPEILDVDFNYDHPDCVFCQISQGKAPADYVYYGGYSYGIVPLNPVVDGHVIFVPHLHVESFATQPEVTGWVFEDAAVWGNKRPEVEANLITSKGKNATQSVFHLHVHYVPRREDDGLKLPWS